MINKVTIWDNKKWRGGLWFVLFLVINFLVYKHFLHHFFYSDDFVWLHHGETIRSDISFLFKIKITSFFSPVINAFFWLGQTLFPYNVEAYHMASIAIHSLNTFLVFVLLKKIFKNTSASVVGSLFFATIPYHYEAIIWISAIMHVIVTTFVLLGLLWFGNFLETKKWWYMVLSLLAGLLAFFTKESGIIFVPLLFGLVLYKERLHIFKKSTLLTLTPFAFLLLGLLVYAWSTQSHSPWVQNGVYHVSPKALYSLCASMLALFDLRIVSLIGDARYVFGLCGIFVFVGAILLWRKKYWDTYALGLYFAVLGFLPVIFFYFGTWRQIAAGRYSYLPSIGAAIIFSSLFLFLKQYCQSKKWLLGLLIALVAGGLWYNVQGVRTFYVQNYPVIDRQMRGMLHSFESEQKVLTPAHHIVLIGSYPFFGNEYYRFFYRHFVDPARQKDIDDWRVVSTDTEAKAYKIQHPDTIFFKWDNRNMRFFRVTVDPK